MNFNLAVYRKVNQYQELREIKREYYKATFTSGFHRIENLIANERFYL
jgi:hypothetical protein